MFSQDLIVTKSNDSIHCKITKLKKDNVYFVYENDGQYQSTLIPLSEVGFYQHNFYAEKKIPKDSMPGFESSPKIRLALNGGFSYDPKKFDNSSLSGLENYYKELRSGYHIEGDFTYFFDKYIGVGVKYSLFKSSNSMDNVNFEYQNGDEATGTLADDISITFIGPQFSSRFLNKSQKNALILNSAIGYLAYKNNQLLVDPITVKGNALGFVFEIGYDIGITENLAFGVQIGATSGNIKKLKIENGPITEEIKLSGNERLQASARLDFSLGLRYIL
jgi:hypothetical protein